MAPRALAISEAMTARLHKTLLDPEGLLSTGGNAAYVRPMRILPSLLAGAVCALLTFSCGSDDDGFTDGNADPQRAECETRPVMSCILSNDSCHEWYSDEAADALYSTCLQIGSVSYDPCPERYSACCIHIEGSDGYPEGVCLSDSATDLAGFKERCASSEGEPEKWCGG